MRGVFVTGTDTGVGKSIVAAAICAALAARGERVAAFKPAVSGLDEEASEWPPDHELLASVASAGQAPEDVSPYRFGPPASPHLAAELAGVVVDSARLRAGAGQAASGAEALVVEGVGGVMVPLSRDQLVRDFAAELGLPVVVVARPGLGTISHTLLTLGAVRACGLRPAGVVMTPWPSRPSVLEASNRETVERLGAVTVSALGPTRRERLAAAGATLPLDDWLGPRPADGSPPSDPVRGSRFPRRPPRAVGAPSSGT